MAISTAIPQSAVASVVGIKTEFKDLRAGNIVFLPQRIAVFGQGATASTYSTTKRQVTSEFEAGTLYGFGSPIHLACKQLFPINGDGVGTLPVTIYPMVDDGSGVASAGDITPSGAQTVAAAYKIVVNEIESEEFVIAVADTVATIVTAMTIAINAVLEMPIIAVDNTTVLDFTSKWEGTSANDIVVEVVGSTTAGTSFAITQAVGGLVNPDVDTPLAQVGTVWESMFLNCLEIADTTTLGKFDTFGEGRWGALVNMPMVTFTGVNITTVAAAIAVSDVRKTDRTNSQLVAPASKNLPFVIAARQLARIAVLADNNPAHNYNSQDATGLVPGADGVQWTYNERDLAVKSGSSTIEVKDGVVNISDVVTFSHPDGQAIPPFRYVVDIVKLQNVLFNFNLVFDSDEWAGAPLINDGDPTVNPDAKTPKAAIAQAASIIDSLGLQAILADVASTKPLIQAEINAGNSKRLDMVVPIKLSGNVNIISIDLNFAFNFG